ncbi:hypothetical protein FVEG_16610 [Fusarium verticillioides 7600]|uniref:Uncharacterized protein n=1 Tax=Gibberella moniliformis (strain M3125 / FGSC 7600) TaxID=334819 RepID=W7MF60_GIBM7|nr:hypothetical protein FVEG_16610 [Fusarium verticillioides 7600]EWG50238.1 hypothetical protein FVEG_16610 [Fusarium verticillioides 7600]
MKFNHTATRNIFSKLFPKLGGFNEEYSLTLEFTISLQATHVIGIRTFTSIENETQTDYANSIVSRGPPKLHNKFSPEELEYCGYLRRLFALLKPTFRQLVVLEVPVAKKFIMCGECCP